MWDNQLVFWDLIQQPFLPPFEAIEHEAIAQSLAQNSIKVLPFQRRACLFWHISPLSHTNYRVVSIHTTHIGVLMPSVYLGLPSFLLSQQAQSHPLNKPAC